MIAELAPYDHVRSAGVEWLPSVPQHWDVRPMLVGFRPRLVKNTGLVEKQVLSLSYGRIVLKSDDELHGLVPESFEGYQIVMPGNIVVRATDLQNDKRSLRVGLVRHKGIITSAYMCLETKPGISSEYGYLVMHAYDVMKLFYGYGSGLRQNLDFRHIKRMPMPIPPPGEQEGIVRFIKHADDRMSRFVETKLALIKLLREQKRALIHGAVTRGVSADVSLKPSGINWLHEVPEHWRVGRIKTELHNLNRTRVPLSTSARGEMTSRLYDYYGASGVIDRVEGYLFDDELLLIAEDGANLVNRNLPLAIKARGRFWVNNHAHVLTPKTGSLDFYAALLESIDYKPWITGAAQPKLTLDRLMAIPIPVPPASEQATIVAWIEANTADLDRAIERAAGEIGLLREFRSRLIADIVTGRLDVRAEAGALSAALTVGDVDASVSATGAGIYDGAPLETDLEEAAV